MEPVCGQGGGRDPPPEKGLVPHGGVWAGWPTSFLTRPWPGKCGAGLCVPGRAGTVAGPVIMRS